MGTRLLIDEEPLQVLPSLAVAIGLNEAIILQQLHYWLKKSEHTMEGKRWIYNTYEQWRSQFPFWSHDTIKRAVHQLEALGLVISTMRFNRNPIDKTKWYCIDYDRLTDFCQSTPTHLGSSTMQDAPTTMQDAPTSGQDASTTMQSAPTTVQDAPIDDARCTDDGASCPHSQRLHTEITTEIPDPPLHPPKGEGVPNNGNLPIGKKPRGKNPLNTNYSLGFTHFWKCYPKGRAAKKPTCFEHWVVNNLEIRTDEICEKVERLKVTTWKDSPPNFIPFSSTWLHDGRYEDELVPLASAPGEWSWVKEVEEQEARRARS